MAEFTVDDTGYARATLSISVSMRLTKNKWNELDEMARRLGFDDFQDYCYSTTDLIANLESDHHRTLAQLIKPKEE